jgi:hypothetical protein
MLTRNNPERIIGDKAYDSDQLADELDEEGIELIAPHRKNRRPENVTQDGRPLRRYKRRWKVERTIAWMHHRLDATLPAPLYSLGENDHAVPRISSLMLFQGFLHFGCAILLLKQVLG